MPLPVLIFRGKEDSFLWKLLNVHLSVGAILKITHQIWTELMKLSGWLEATLGCLMGLSGWWDWWEIEGLWVIFIDSYITWLYLIEVNVKFESLGFVQSMPPSWREFSKTLYFSIKSSWRIWNFLWLPQKNSQPPPSNLYSTQENNEME